MSAQRPHGAGARAGPPFAACDFGARRGPYSRGEAAEAAGGLCMGAPRAGRAARAGGVK
jgi:hypothetical protein